jgi:hypothetical protein
MYSFGNIKKKLDAFIASKRPKGQNSKSGMSKVPILEIFRGYLVE